MSQVCWDVVKADYEVLKVILAKSIRFDFVSELDERLNDAIVGEVRIVPVLVFRVLDHQLDMEENVVSLRFLDKRELTVHRPVK